eukprot:6121535-Alexandrium_andersonii.AAC.1
MLEVASQDAAVASEAVRKEVEARQNREAAFLNRKRPRDEKQKAAWKPQKRYRKTSYQWFCLLYTSPSPRD